MHTQSHKTVDVLHEFHLSLIIRKKKFEMWLGCQNLHSV
jgi:hypothetical protein